MYSFLHTFFHIKLSGIFIISKLVFKKAARGCVFIPLFNLLAHRLRGARIYFILSTLIFHVEPCKKNRGYYRIKRHCINIIFYYSHIIISVQCMVCTGSFISFLLLSSFTTRPLHQAPSNCHGNPCHLWSASQLFSIFFRYTYRYKIFAYSHYIPSLPVKI